ncbi:MAG: hypothetical protein JWO70_5451 [Betaproteobacteria bacterium]|nr:hypothetical protein [Betaproteobacteria bacterium]
MMESKHRLNEKRARALWVQAVRPYARLSAQIFRAHPQA